MLKLKCECHTCKARVLRDFRRIADSVFTRSEIEGIAQAVTKDYSIKQLDSFLFSERCDNG